VTSALAAKRRAAGYTQESLAERLGKDRTTIGRWERGEVEPYAWNLPPLAEALGVTLEELDALRPRVLVAQGEPDDYVGLTYSRSLPDTVATIAALGRYDLDRRSFLTSAVFAAAASIGPSRDWLLGALDQVTSARGKVSSEEVASIRRTFEMFQEMDVMRGGGFARSRLTDFFTAHVVPLLRENDPETEAGRVLYEAASEQLYLLGWMAFDNGEHVVAQRYLIQALRLAEAARAPELGAHVLAGLADQATLTGHPDQGRSLALTGRHGLSKGRSPACLADLLALQGRAEAALGDAKAATACVTASEKAFEMVDAENEPEWARFIDVAYLNGEYACTFRDLGRPQETAHFAQLSAEEAKRQRRARRGSLAHAALADAAIGRNDVDEAAHEALTTVRLAATVDSSRSRDAVHGLRVKLQPNEDVASVAEFMETSRVLMAV
jgi:transcriptional regulator with XRE-family HTH domain